MKICYYPQQCTTPKHKNVKAYSSVASSLFLYLPMYAANKALSITIMVIALLLAAYSVYILYKVFTTQKMTPDEMLKEYKRQKELQKMYEELRGPQKATNVKATNLL